MPHACSEIFGDAEAHSCPALQYRVSGLGTGVFIASDHLGKLLPREPDLGAQSSLLCSRSLAIRNINDASVQDWMPQASLSQRLSSMVVDATWRLFWLVAFRLALRTVHIFQLKSRIASGSDSLLEAFVLITPLGASDLLRQTLLGSCGACLRIHWQTNAARTSPFPLLNVTDHMHLAERPLSVSVRHGIWEVKQLL